MSGALRLHYVILNSTVLLVKRSVDTWRELQDEFHDYSASLGPWTAADIEDYFTADMGKDDSHWPFSRRSIAAFVASPRSTILGPDGRDALPLLPPCVYMRPDT
jgi:hypothetical protein